MNTDRAAALRALPLFLLLSDETPDSGFTDVFKISDHAHAIFRAVAFIQLFQSNTGEPGAFKTEFRLTGGNRFTVLDCACYTRFGFVRVVIVAPGTLILFSHMRIAERTIHPAWRDHCRLNRFESHGFLRIHVITQNNGFDDLSAD